jgi:hypothetical protein
MLAESEEEILYAKVFMSRLLSSLEPCQKLKIQLSVEKQNEKETQTPQKSV